MKEAGRTFIILSKQNVLTEIHDYVIVKRKNDNTF